MHWRHHFKPVAVQHKYGRITYVLSKCACGQTKTEELKGEWTLADLATPINNKDSELNLLRQMAGLKKK